MSGFDRYARIVRKEIEALRKPFMDLPHERIAEINKVASRTTILAIRCDADQSLVVGSDGLVSSWGQKARTNMDKTFMLDEYSALAICGFASPGIHATRILRYMFDLYRYDEDRDLSVDGKLQLVDMVTEWFCDAGLYFFPIFAAHDPKAGHGRIFDLWGVGGGHDEQERYYANGSGGDTARTILEDQFGGIRATDDAIRVAICAIHRASHRVYSANEPQHIKVLTKEGFERVARTRIQKELDEIRRLKCPLCREEREGGVV